MNISKCDIVALAGLTAAELQRKYAELFGAEPVSNNRRFLERKIAYRLQEMAIGGLPADLKTKIDGLITRYDPVNCCRFKAKHSSPTGRDSRLPLPGSLITKTYKGKRIEVKVLESGFEYEGVIYKNLSHVAKVITGDKWNGFLFFGYKPNGK